LTFVFKIGLNCGTTCKVIKIIGGLQILQALQGGI